MSNEWNRSVEQAKKGAEKTRQKILKEILNIECRLSPENLTCDGMLSPASVRKKYRELQILLTAEYRKFRQITKIIEGKARDPTFKEIWG